MKIDRKYYRVHPDSPVMAVLKRATEQQRVFIDAMKALDAEFGGSTWTTNNARFAGIQFPGEPPHGWRKLKDRKYAVPNKRIKAGRDLDWRFHALPIGVDAWIFAGMLQKEFGRKFEHWGDGVIALPSAQKFGDVQVLGVPLPVAGEIPGCEELKMSEYWQLREAAGSEAEE
jgi:hypothetical protein